MPPGPIVSCPSTPWPSGTPSSIVRPSRPPTRIAVNTKSGALERVVEVGRGPERHAVAVLGGLAFQHLRDALQPLGVDVVQHDLVERPAARSSAP